MHIVSVSCKETDIEKTFKNILFNMWNYILLIIGIPIALFIVYRFFWTLSIGGRAIAIGLVLGSLFYYMGVRFWIGAVIGVIIGLLLPLLFDLLGLDYEFLEKKTKCHNCGSTRLQDVVESNGNGDYYTHCYCKSCGYKLY